MKEFKVPKHNYLLDVFKLIAAFSVVIFHVSYILPYSIRFFTFQFAVPFFFAISGFFSFKKFDNGDAEYFKRKIKQTFKLYLICCILYIILYISAHLLKKDFIEYLEKGLSLEMIIKYVVFNNPIFSGGHLWFILALLYVYIYVFLIIRFRKNDLLLNLIFSMLLIAFAAVIDIVGDFSQVITRNWLFYGLPCFFIGVFIGKKQDKIRNIKLIYYLAILVLSLVFKFLIQYFKLYIRSDISIFIMIFSFTILCISIKYCNLIKENRINKYFGELSMYIYILHWGVMAVIKNIKKSINLTDSLLLVLIEIFTILFITLFSSFLIIFFKENILKKSSLK